MSSEPATPSGEPATGARQLAPREATGARVWVATAREQDIAPYRRAVGRSGPRLARWNPVDPDDLARALSLQSGDRRTFLIHAVSPEGDHDIVGKVNVSDAVRGRFESAAVGYDAYDPYAGRGLFAEGLRLVLDLLFTPQDAGGFGLHRVQAAVQPGNVRSAGLLRSLGFQREGFSPRMLWLPGADGNNAWRDHDCYVVMSDEWPAAAYRAAPGRKIVTLVNRAPGSGTAHGVPVSGTRALARQLAAELRVPVFSRDVAGSLDLVWALLADSPAGGVVEGCFPPGEARSVAEGLRLCGLEPGSVPEVWCWSSPDEASARPLGLGATLAVNTGGQVSAADVVRIALEVASGQTESGHGAGGRL